MVSTVLNCKDLSFYLAFKYQIICRRSFNPVIIAIQESDVHLKVFHQLIHRYPAVSAKREDLCNTNFWTLLPHYHLFNVNRNFRDNGGIIQVHSSVDAVFNHCFDDKWECPCWIVRRDSCIVPKMVKLLMTILLKAIRKSFLNNFELLIHWAFFDANCRHQN